MLRKHAVFIGILASALLILVATWVYPGGNWADPQAVGFKWTKNFISNLFQPKAINGADSSSRYWADAGMILLSASFALFFAGYARRIPSPNAKRVTRWAGFAAMVCMVLIVTPLHDLMVALSSTFFLLALFYITVFVWRSRLHLFKFLCTAVLAITYFTLYLYGTAQVEYLAVMQKVTFLSVIGLVLALEYFTKAEDFNPSV